MVRLPCEGQPRDRLNVPHALTYVRLAAFLRALYSKSVAAAVAVAINSRNAPTSRGPPVSAAATAAAAQNVIKNFLKAFE